MDETNVTNESEAKVEAEAVLAAPIAAAAPAPTGRDGRPERPRRGGPGGRGGSSRPRRGNFERVKPEFDQKMIEIRRVARVVAGGRRFSFSVAIVIGDRKGSVGVGTGKAADTALAIDKAVKNAKKNMLVLSLNKKMSIPHELSAKYSSARVFMIPNHGKGLVAGSSIRTVLDLGGVKDVSAKVLSGSKNRLNNARAAVKALSVIGAPRR